VAELNVALLVVGLELDGVDDGVVGVGQFVEDEFGLFLDCAPHQDAAVEVRCEGGDREAFIVDETLRVFFKIVCYDFVGCYISKCVYINYANFISRH
jgi:hypothetical protein